MKPSQYKTQAEKKFVFRLHPSKSLYATEVKENPRDKYSRSRLTTIMKL